MYVCGITNSLRGFNITLTGQMTTSRIFCYGDSSISVSISINKSQNIFFNRFGVCSRISALSRLMKASITCLTGYNLKLTGTLTTSGIFSYGNTSISGLLCLYNMLCKKLYNNIRIYDYQRNN